MEMELDRLKQSAVLARSHAYVPYSHYAVGAALLDHNGHIHTGCNVENAAYGPTNCAERTALFRAIADGLTKGQFKAIAVVADSKRPVTPCGTCRQVMAELCPPDMPVWLGNLNGQWSQTTVADLLPGAFNANDMKHAKEDQ